MKRIRKRGRAEAVRAYRRHISLRLSYLEAEVLDKVLNFAAYMGPDQEMRALGRIKRKVHKAAQVDPEEIRVRNIRRRIKRLEEKIEACQKSVIEPDYRDRADLAILKRSLENADRVWGEEKALDG